MGKITLKLDLKFTLPWSDEVPEVVDRSFRDSNSSFIELPGPTLTIKRRGLHLMPGAGGLLGMLDTNSEMAILLDLSNEPNLLGTFEKDLCGMASKSEDGMVFVAGKAGLSKISRGNLHKAVFPGLVSSLVALENGIAIAGTSDGLTMVNADGEQLHSWPFNLNGLVLGDAGRCFFFKKSDSAGLLSIDNSGEVQEFPNCKLGPFERLVFADGETYVTNAKGGFKRASVDGNEAYLPLLCAGLDHKGNAFASGYQDGKTMVVQQNEAVRWLDIPAQIQDGLRPYYVFAIEQQGFWVRGDASLLLFSHDGQLLRQSELDNQILEQEVFPRAWFLDDFVWQPGEGFLASCVGPAGHAILGMDW